MKHTADARIDQVKILIGLREIDITDRIFQFRYLRVIPLQHRVCGSGLHQPYKDQDQHDRADLPCQGSPLPGPSHSYHLPVPSLINNSFCIVQIRP